MPSEHAFLRQRLALVEQELANPDREFIRDGKGRALYWARLSGKRDFKRELEALLLRELLARTQEGQVLTTLKAGRRRYRQRSRDMQETHDLQAQFLDDLIERLQKWLEEA